MLTFEKDYFLGETRNDFYIEPMMKCAWAAELEVLETVRQICEAHGIKYFAAYGTLLGAVRHKGFIPWDDDIDIMMFREDYDRFLSIASVELPNEYRIYTPYNTEDHKTAFAFLANAASVSYSPKRLQAFHGFPYIAGIDIMPLDILPDTSVERNAFFLLFNIIMSCCLKWEEQTEEVMESLSEIEELCHTAIDRTGNIPHQLCLLADHISQCYKDSESPYVSCVTYAAPANRTLLREWYADCTWMPFENTEIPVPNGYDRILTTIFGDYMTPVFWAPHDYPFYKAQEEKVKAIVSERIRRGESPFDNVD